MSVANSIQSGSSRGAGSSGKPAAGKTTIDDAIRGRLKEARQALWRAELVRSCLQLAIASIVILLVWVVLDQWVLAANKPFRLLALLAAMAGLVWYLRWRIAPIFQSTIRPEYAARALERDVPEMGYSLTSYVTLRDEMEPGSLASRVVRSLGSQAASQLRAHDQVPTEAMGTFRWWIAAAIALALLAAYAVISPKNSAQSAARLFAPLASIDAPRRVSITDVQPGDVEAIAGRMLEVSAKIRGLRPQEPVLIQWASGAVSHETEMLVEEDVRRYVGQIELPHAAAGEVLYSIAAGDAVKGPFRLMVQDVPVVAVQSIRYEPPPYTGESPHTSSSGAITAVDGTVVRLRAGTNRSVTKAKIEFNPKPLGDSIRASAGATELQIDEAGTGLTVSFSLRSAKGRSAAVELESYRIKVWNESGQTNPDPIIYPIRVIPDLPPEVSIVMPRQSPKEIPIDAQQVIEVHAVDADFGLKHVGLEIRSGIDLIAEPTLWSEQVGASGNRVSEYRFRPAQHDLDVGDKVEIVAVATDNRYVASDPSIEPNRARTDPIELRIVASEPLPQDPTGADGLTPPDDRPASDEPGEQGEQGGQQGEQGGQQGEQGGQQGEQGGQQGEQGGQQGEQGGQQGEQGGQQGEQGGQQGEQGGQQGEQGGQQGEQGGQQGEQGGQQGEQGGQPGEQGGQQGEQGGQQGEQGGQQGEQGGQPGQGGQPPEGSQQPQETGSNGQPGQSGDSGSPGAGGSSDQQGEPGQSADSGPQSEGSGDASSNEAGTRNQQGDPASAQSGSGAGSSQESSPPEHAGEAMERIRDYLNEKQGRNRGGGQSQPDRGKPKRSWENRDRACHFRSRDSRRRSPGAGVFEYRR